MDQSPGLKTKFRVEIHPRVKLIKDYLVIPFSVNLSEDYISSIMRPEVVAAAKEAYNIPDDMPEDCLIGEG